MRKWTTTEQVKFDDYIESFWRVIVKFSCLREFYKAFCDSEKGFSVNQFERYFFSSESLETLKMQQLIGLFHFDPNESEKKKAMKKEEYDKCIANTSRKEEFYSKLLRKEIHFVWDVYKFSNTILGRDNKYGYLFKMCDIEVQLNNYKELVLEIKERENKFQEIINYLACCTEVFNGIYDLLCLSLDDYCETHSLKDIFLRFYKIIVETEFYSLIRLINVDPNKFLSENIFLVNLNLMTIELPRDEIEHKEDSRKSLFDELNARYCPKCQETPCMCSSVD